MRNEPNLEEPGDWQAASAKQSQMAVAGSRSEDRGTNKANSGERGRDSQTRSIAFGAPRSPYQEPSCETNPIAPNVRNWARGEKLVTEPGGAKDAKRTQSPRSTRVFQARGCRTNEANWRYDADREIGVPGGRSCQTKPMGGRRVASGDATKRVACQTKPIGPCPSQRWAELPLRNSERGRSRYEEGRRDKQSQFAAGPEASAAQLLVETEVMSFARMPGSPGGAAVSGASCG